MGTSHSTQVPSSLPTNETIPSISTTTTSPTLVEKNQSEQKRNRKRNPKNLTGAALVEYRCRKKKKAWSSCVGTFYQRFSSGKVLEDEEADCDDLFEQYRSCYMKGMLMLREKKGLDPPKEGTILAEFVEEEGLDLSSR